MRRETGARIGRRVGERHRDGHNHGMLASHDAAGNRRHGYRESVESLCASSNG